MNIFYIENKLHTPFENSIAGDMAGDELYMKKRGIWENLFDQLLRVIGCAQIKVNSLFKVPYNAYENTLLTIGLFISSSNIIVKY